MESPTYIAHHGVKGQKWGVRKYQYENGTLTPEGRKRYSGMNYTTSQDPKIHRVKVKGAGSKRGKYRNANKQHQSNAQAPSYSYVDSEGTTYSYSGEDSGNNTTDVVGEMVYAERRKEQLKKNKRLRTINKAKVFIGGIPKSIKNATLSAISNAAHAISSGVSFIRNLIKR